jgi:hypothetical protein
MVRLDQKQTTCVGSPNRKVLNPFGYGDGHPHSTVLKQLEYGVFFLRLEVLNVHFSDGDESCRDLKLFKFESQ